MAELQLPPDFDMTPRDALEYARMAKAYSDGFIRACDGYVMMIGNMRVLGEVGSCPFRRPRTSAATERAMTNEEINAAVALPDSAVVDAAEVAE